MARPANPKSVRQKSFKLLDTLTNVKRENAIRILMTTYKIGLSYASTLYASHRTLNKENGNMSRVFSVRDMRDGKAVEPYIKITNTFNPDADAALNIVHAKKNYELALKNRIAKAKQLS